MTNKQLQNLCRVWQKRLCLQDWKVSVQMAGRDASNDGHARTRISDNFKEARIFICRPEDCDPDWHGKIDAEQSLVHELLHLHADTFDKKIEDKSAEQKYLEFTIDAIANSLVELSRKRTK